jgi:hypothetical protein
MNGSEMLEKLHARCENKIDFKSEWENGTGYLDGAVHMQLKGADGTVYASVDDHQRKIILVKTCFGNVVVFQRYKDGAHGAVVGNVPSELRTWLPTGAWSADALEMNTNTYQEPSLNIGIRLNVLRRDFDRIGYKTLQTVNGTPMKKVMVLLGNSTDTDGITISEGIVVREDKNGHSFAIALPYGVCIATNIVEKVNETDEYYYSTSSLPLSATNLKYRTAIENMYGVPYSDELLLAMRSVKTLKTFIRSKQEAMKYISERCEFIND